MWRRWPSWQWYGGVYKDARDQRNFFARLGVEADKLFKVYTNYVLPEAEKQAFIGDPAGCVVNKALAERFGFKTGDKILSSKATSSPLTST